MAALLGASCDAGATPAPAAPAGTAADTTLGNYAFASELGSGVYEINGSTIQVYQIEGSYRLRFAERPRGRPGLKFILPVTVGFFDFRTQDLAELHIPTHIGALSFEPGAQLDYWLDEDWHVYPYVKGGASFASSSSVNAWIWGMGVRSDLRFSIFNGADLWSAALTYAGVHYTSQLPDDSFTRLRNGLDLRHLIGGPFRDRHFEIGLYGISDIYLDAPQGPASGISAKTLQFEGGIMFGTNPTYQIMGIAVPRLGIGYRAAGTLSGWRLVIGEPF